MLSREFVFLIPDTTGEGPPDFGLDVNEVRTDEGIEALDEAYRRVSRLSKLAAERAIANSKGGKRWQSVAPKTPEGQVEQPLV